MSEDEAPEALLPDRVVRAGDGTISLRLVARERTILRALLEDLRAVLEKEPRIPGMTSGEEPGRPGPDPVHARLYPDARPDDPAAGERFRDLVQADLAEGRMARLALVEESLDARSIDDVQAAAWLGVLNDLRLVMGTRLEVTEETEAEPIDDEDPDAAARIVYAYAGWLEGQFVEVLADALPDVPADEEGKP